MGYDFFRTVLRLPFTGPVLEVGAGRDRTVRELFGRRHKVTTVNIYPKNVVDAIASVTCLPYKDKTFGCVVCEHVLEHVVDPKKALSEIYRVLKPKGLLILSVPFSWPLHEKPFDLWRFTEEGLRVLLTPSFEKLDFTPHRRHPLQAPPHRLDGPQGRRDQSQGEEGGQGP